jgi:hypothetical protein
MYLFFMRMYFFLCAYLLFFLYRALLYRAIAFCVPVAAVRPGCRCPAARRDGEAALAVVLWLTPPRRLPARRPTMIYNGQYRPAVGPADDDPLVRNVRHG